GFPAQRPDKEWKAGPDNLWCVREGEYVLFECKSEVNVLRKEIHKEETGQMNNAIAWFEETYPGTKVRHFMFIRARNIAEGAGFNRQVQVIRNGNLKKLRRHTGDFFREFAGHDLKDLSEGTIGQALDTHNLSVDAIQAAYGESTRTNIQ